MAEDNANPQGGDAEGQDGAGNQDNKATSTTTKETTTWFDTIDPLDRGIIENKGWGKKDSKPEDVLKNTLTSYKELEKFRGASPEELIKIPKVDDVEGWKKVHQRLGTPETPDKYGEFAMPEGRQANPELVKSFKEMAHGAGLTDPQFKTLAEGYAKMEADLEKQLNEARKVEFDREMIDLKGEWKGQFDERKEMAKRSGLALGLTEQDLDLGAEAWGAAKLYKVLAKIGDATQESIGRITGDGKRDFGISPDGARAKLEEMMARPDFMEILKNRNSPDGREYERLNYIANGGDAPATVHGGN